MSEIKTCPTCGFRVLPNNTGEFLSMITTGVCRWCKSQGRTPPKPEPEKSMGIGGDLMRDAEFQVIALRDRMGHAAFDKFAAGIATPGPIAPRAGHPEFYAILAEMAALHEKKAADYGLGADVLANCRSSTDFGIPAWVGVVMRMNDKMIRLKSFAQKGVLANESAEDSLLDIACYAIIAAILMREGKK